MHKRLSFPGPPLPYLSQRRGRACSSRGGWRNLLSGQEQSSQGGDGSPPLMFVFCLVTGSTDACVSRERGKLVPVDRHPGASLRRRKGDTFNFQAFKQEQVSFLFSPPPLFHSVLSLDLGLKSTHSEQHLAPSPWLDVH